MLSIDDNLNIHNQLIELLQDNNLKLLLSNQIWINNRYKTTILIHIKIILTYVYIKNTPMKMFVIA